MNYTQRRLLRQRMMRRAVFNRQCKDVAATIKDFIPEVITAIVLIFGVFYLIPILCAALSGQLPV